jgi:D-3-phosphoglycerate dehydrogenase
MTAAPVEEPSLSKTSLDKDRIKVVLLEGVHESAVEALRANGYTWIEYHPKSLPDAELKAALSDAYIVGIRSATNLSSELFHDAQKLVCVGCFCIGTNQVDLDAAEKLGVPVFNAPFSNTRSVAELVLAEAIMLTRGIPARNAAAHRGEWIKTAVGSHEVRGKCLGIVGYGHIGTQVGVLAEGVGMQVVYYDIETKLALGNARPMHTLDALLEASDVVTIHVPETPETTGMMGKAQFARMKQGSRFINAARGTVVDIDALSDAVRSKHIAGAAIDVFPQEPRTTGEEFVSPLRGLDNVILTPHIGGSTEEAQQNIGTEVADKLMRYSNNGSTLGAVNFPEVSLPAHPGKQRLLHIHNNQPGVLSKVNAVFSSNEINIVGQYLQTNPRIGYVVIDIDTGEREEALQLKRLLDQVPGTIRTRILY